MQIHKKLTVRVILCLLALIFFREQMTTNDSNDGAAEKLTDIEEAGFQALRPGLVHAIRSLVEELNKIRGILGLEEVSIVGLGESEKRRSGITEEGRQKLREMMKQRWQRAYAEKKHVTQLKGPLTPPEPKKPKPPPQKKDH